MGNTAFSIYNSLQTNVTTRNFHGFTGTVQYTYSRTIDNTSEIYPTGAGGNTLEYAQNPLNTNTAERGVSGISYPNVFAFGFVYQVPQLVHDNGFLGKLANGFSINTIYGYNSGQPFTPFQGLQPNPTNPQTAVGGTYCDDYFNQFVLGSNQLPADTDEPKCPKLAYLVRRQQRDHRRRARQSLPRSGKKHTTRPNLQQSGFEHFQDN